MKKFLLTAAAMMMIFSCTKKEDLLKEQEKGTGVVGVKTEVSNGTRGVALNSNTDLIASQNGFDLFAYQSDGNIFMGTETDGIEFEYENGWDYADAGEVVFWQQVTEGNTVDFYAVSPANLYNTGYGTPSIGYDYENGAQKITYTVPYLSSDQKDLMYSRVAMVDPTNTDVINNGVQLDFYHALSQIVFSARVHEEDTTHITATVTGLDICNLHGSGEFTFKEAPYGEYVEAADYTPWTYSDEQVNSYTAEVAAEVDVNLALDGATEELTNSETALLLLPQELTGATIDEYGNVTDQGTYIKVTCKVYYQGNNGVQTQIIGENDGVAEIYIPLSSTWKAGYKYVYTLVFSKDIADPITIHEDLSVAEWYDGGNTDIPGEDEDDENGGDEPVEEIVEIEGLRYSVTHQRFYIDDAEDLNTMASLIDRTLNDEHINFNDHAYLDPVDNTYKSFAKATYVQTADIDLSNIEPTIRETGNGGTGKMNFSQIGGSSTPSFFMGTYDGQEYKIKGLSFEKVEDNQYFIALFYTIKNATIANLTVEGTIASSTCTGGIVSVDNGNSTIINCVSNVDIAADYRMAAGIVGEANSTQIIECINNGDIIGSNCDYVGGIVGLSKGSTTLTACVNNGNVSGDYDIGGLVGIENEAGISIYASYNTGTVNATAINSNATTHPVGGIIGKLQGKIIGCYNLGEVQIKGSTYDQEDYGFIGAIAGVEWNSELEPSEAIKACYWGGECVSDNGFGISGWSVSDEVMNAMNDALNATDCGYIFQPNDDSSLLIPVASR